METYIDMLSVAYDKLDRICKEINYKGFRKDTDKHINEIIFTKEFLSHINDYLVIEKLMFHDNVNPKISRFGKILDYLDTPLTLVNYFYDLVFNEK